MPEIRASDTAAQKQRRSLGTHYNLQPLLPSQTKHYTSTSTHTSNESRQHDIGRSAAGPRRRRRGLPRLYGGACRGCTAGLTRRRPRWTGTGREPSAANGCGPGPFGPSITFSLVSLFVSCDDGDGDEAGREPVFLLLAGGGAGWDRQMDRSEMLLVMYDLPLGH